MKRSGIYFLITLLVAGICWRFPLFRVVPLAEVNAAKVAAEFDAHDFASDFWEKQLVPSFPQATAVQELLTALEKDPEGARLTFGRSVGIGRVYYFFFARRGPDLIC